MKTIKIAIIVLVSFLMSFVFWYGVMWFFTNQSNGFEWSFWIKLFYFLLSSVTFNNFVRELHGSLKEEN